MEELLATIPNHPIRDYMREAMNCYMASAYRGCIVLSYIALFDYLLSQLDELSKVNASAKTIFDEATKKKEDQDVYENYLICQLASKTLLSGLDASFLDTLRKLRNKSAHPSGHQPSAEEARFIFHEVVSRFLSRPILTTLYLVDDILGRLSNSNFFPSQMLSDIKGVLAEEIATLHEEAVPVLVTKLTSLTVSPDSIIAKNSRHFLIGLALLNKDGINKELQKRILSKKSDNSKYFSLILRLLSANGRLIVDLPTVTIGRIRRALLNRIDEVEPTTLEAQTNHPTTTFVSIAKHVDDEYLLSHFKVELEKLFHKRPYSPYLIHVFKNRQEIVAVYYPIMLEKARSSDFHTANKFPDSIEQIDSKLAQFCSLEQAFQLCVAVHRAAEFGAFSSIELRDSKFKVAPKLRTRAIEYVKDNELDAEAYLQAQLGITETINSFLSTYLTDEPVTGEPAADELAL